MLVAAQTLHISAEQGAGRMTPPMLFDEIGRHLSCLPFMFSSVPRTWGGDRQSRCRQRDETDAPLPTEK